MSSDRTLTFILLLLSLAFIACGCWLMYRPLAFIAVGLLLWFDLFIGELMRSRGP